MVISRRARSQDQKGERRQEILAAAITLLREKPYHKITMADVAKKAGMAKGTLFLYFGTKEELFLVIVSREFERWFDAMDRAFTDIVEGSEPGSGDRVLTALRGMLKEDSLLVSLIPILHTILEQNIGYDKAKEFKEMLGQRLRHTGMLLEKCLTFVEKGQGTTFLLWMYALVIGFTQMAAPSPVIKKVFQNNPALRMMQIDFGRSYVDALGVILDGWKSRNAHRKKGQ